MDNKVKVADALEMSLDQYIRNAGISDYRKTNSGYSDKNSADITIDSDEDNDEDMPELDQSVNYFGKRIEDLPKLRSQQWRLMPPNIQADRPAGMPPLVPACVAEKEWMAPQQTTKSAQDLTIEVDNDKSSGVCSNITISNQKKRKRRHLGNTDNRRNRQRQHNTDANNAYDDGAIESYGVARSNNTFKSGRLSVHQRIDYSYLNRKDRFEHHGREAITSTSASITSTNKALQYLSANLLAAANATAEHTKRALAAPPVAPAVVEQQPTLTQMSPVDLLEQIDALQRAKVEKKYDIVLQKEICKLQGKPLLYTCPGASVISSDGPGVELDKPLTHSTTMSMNHRFA